VARVARVLRSGGYLSVRELMCTVSFIPKDQGFYLAMNRDEKRSRSIALPPRIVTVAGCRAIFPREPNGGTWIAVNDAGVCLALINWHRIQRNPADEIASRGQVTANLAGAASSNDIADAMMEMTLHNLRPFRLITIVPAERVMTEWRWDLELLTPRRHEWERKHWFSSGFDEITAELERSCICDAAHEEKSRDSLASLRLLHRSHAPERGPFSICMHRADAVTVSYTEVVVSTECVVMRYKNDAPCSSNSVSESSLARRVAVSFRPAPRPIDNARRYSSNFRTGNSRHVATRPRQRTCRPLRGRSRG